GGVRGRRARMERWYRLRRLELRARSCPAVLDLPLRRRHWARFGRVRHLRSEGGVGAVATCQLFRSAATSILSRATDDGPRIPVAYGAALGARQPRSFGRPAAAAAGRWQRGPERRRRQPAGRWKDARAAAERLSRGAALSRRAVAQVALVR